MANVILTLVVIFSVFNEFFCELMTENEIPRYESADIFGKSPASHLPYEIDLFKLMNVSAKDQGVSQVEGPIKKYPAYKFRLPYGNVPLPNGTLVTGALNSKEGFTVLFLYRQQKNNLGTLISINAPGRLTPWFQLNSNSKSGNLNLRYRTLDSLKLRQVEINLPKHHKKSPMAAWLWLSLSVDYKTSILRLDIDCQPSRYESLSSKNSKTRISIPKDSLVYFRQEPGRKKKFLGSMQVAKILPYFRQARSWSCMEISDNLPTNLVKPIS
ncbi:unnamed protein product [Brassicogethes aeneus]|uniref:Kielin/chordin-like protein n=1 Tax=Brassicogethes aeneus TaxID=1431903 RepID=A0A9P0BBS7_BRAAE|nr:unnamed protein product [Brassicogethes aeneus]